MQQFSAETVVSAMGRSERNGRKLSGATLPILFVFALPPESFGRNSRSGGKQISSRDDTDELDVALGDVLRITSAETVVALERVEA